MIQTDLLHLFFPLVVKVRGGAGCFCGTEPDEFAGV